MKTFKEYIKMNESFPAFPRMANRLDSDENYNKWEKERAEWENKSKAQLDTIVPKIIRMAERFGADILSSRINLGMEARVDALNEIEKIYNALDKLMDKTKIKKN